MVISILIKVIASMRHTVSISNIVQFNERPNLTKSVKKCKFQYKCSCNCTPASIIDTNTYRDLFKLSKVDVKILFNTKLNLVKLSFHNTFSLSFGNIHCGSPVSDQMASIADHLL